MTIVNFIAIIANQVSKIFFCLLKIQTSNSFKNMIIPNDDFFL